ncbi:hypothetical protein G647_10308, partial [Cladophialophora carrionii CBS 160.54]
MWRKRLPLRDIRKAKIWLYRSQCVTCSKRRKHY